MLRNIKQIISKKHAVALVILICLFIATVLFAGGKPYKKDYSQYIDEWGIYNSGQNIEGKKGVSGWDIDIIPAWEITKGSSDVIVAVVDTGVDISCEIFEKTQILSGWDFYNNDATIYDQYIHDYHGTYICSTIAKIAPGITILPIKFMESTAGSMDDAVKGILFAIEHGADIINCSWNFYEYNQELYEVIKEHPDVLFVCAAGNYNADLDNSLIYPCSYKLDNIINVLAVDNTGAIYGTSGYGKNSVHIAAPGESVKVILPENDETYVDGTSVATAFVSATASLVLSNNFSLTTSEIKNIILTSVQPLDALKNKCVSGGMVNVYNSLKQGVRQ